MKLRKITLLFLIVVVISLHRKDVHNEETDDRTEIPAYCFCDCSISSIIIPNGVTHIGEYAIYRNWEAIETVILPTTVQFVGYNAFPEETYVIALSPDTHFETAEEYQLRCPDGELW